LLFVGDDWAEAHHDIEIQDNTGRRLAGRRLPEGLAEGLVGIAALHALIAEHLPGDAGPVLTRWWSASRPTAGCGRRR
jgi:hypothetical protein